MHYDHAGCLDLFPAAAVHVQDREMAFCTGRPMGHEALRTAFRAEDVVSAVRHVHAGRVRFHDGSGAIAPGVTLHLVGGHTAGTQVVRVPTARGWVVLASDTTHLWANIRERNPFPIVADVTAMLEGYRQVESLADGPDHVIPGHDPLVRTRFPTLPGIPTSSASTCRPCREPRTPSGEAGGLTRRFAPFPGFDGAQARSEDYRVANGRTAMGEPTTVARADDDRRVRGLDRLPVGRRRAQPLTSRAGGSRAFADIDAEEFYDFTALRPQVRLRRDQSREIVWPANRFLAASTPDAHDVIIMIGTEPHLRWRTFCECVTTVATELQVEAVFTLGAMLADVAHTRPPVPVLSADPRLAERLGLRRPQYQGPTGIVGVLQDAFAQASIPVGSLMAQVPHYIPGMPSPKATLAVVGRMSSCSRSRFPPGPREGRVHLRTPGG